ncbi:MAG: tetratricopeptide repeat protein [Gemmatimonadales bacterium]
MIKREREFGSRRSIVWLLFPVGCAFLVPLTMTAQQPPMARAYELERKGDYAEAVEVYRGILAGRPGDVAALLGLERALTPINRLPELLPEVRAGLAASPTNGVLFSIALRAWGMADQPDSLRATAERWAAAAPDDDAPYREWGGAALAHRDRATARRAYLLGRERLHSPDALAPELAQMAILDADYPTALREWLLAVKKLAGYQPSAVITLSQAPQGIRSELLAQLDRDEGAVARGIEADLLARWGDPAGAFRKLSAALSPSHDLALIQLQRFLEQIRGPSSREALQTKGQALEAMADRVPPAQQGRFRLEAARAYSEAGDRASARRILAQLQTLTGGTSVGATVTLIGLLVDQGNVEEAAGRLEQARSSLPVDDYEHLRREVAWGWARAGRLDRAEPMAAGDSTVEGIALWGMLRLCRGDLAAARAALKAAGPFAGSRQDATTRAALLTLLQAIEADTLLPLGDAFLHLEQGDTVSAAAGFESVAGTLPAEAGGAELRLLAGGLFAARGKAAEAERLLRAVGAGGPATAAAADLELATLYLAANRRPEATEVLEHLILTYPDSALVPQARRLLDQARGAVPET